MKKLLLAALLLTFGFTAVSAQSSQMTTADQMNQRVTFDAKLKQLTKADHMMTAKTIIPQDEEDVPRPNGVAAVNPVELGRSSNAFTILRMEQNQVFASDDLGVAGFIHRHDVTIYGGGTTENGKYRYDISTDGGATFTNDIGVLNSTYTLRSRYPNATLYNPSGNSNPFSANVVWNGPTLAPSTSWDGHVAGVSDINVSGSTSTENYLFSGDRTLLPGGLTQGLPGEYWSVDIQYDGSATQDSIYVYKGTWNSATSDVDWVRFAAIDPGHDKTLDGTITAVGPNIAFGPGGQNGYIAWLGDITGGPQNYAVSPCFIRTSDGGVTWSAPYEADMNTVSWVADTLQSFWITVDSLTGDTVPAGTGIATTGFDFDLAVDAAGAAHLGVVVGNSPDGGGYSISSGLVKFLGDVVWDGTTLDVNYMGSVLTFRGEFGTPDPTDGSLLTIDNAVQVSRTEDGTKIFFSWVDSDTALIGFGEANNIAPNLRYCGLEPSTGEQTVVVKATDGDFIFDGVCYTPVMAPTVLSGSNNDYWLPIVSLDMITNDQLAPCKFWYFGNDAGLTDDCFEPVSSLNLTAEGFVLIDDLTCLGVGIEEEIAEQGLQHVVFPNPTTNNATIRFDLPVAAEVTYNVVSVMGTEVISGTTAKYPAGINNIDLNTQNLAAGLYFYNLKVGNQVFSSKLMINR